jgi:pimeloyl-ACP methyl ester carboxylesterase
MRRLMRKIIKWAVIVFGGALGVLIVWCLIPLRPTIPAIKHRPNAQFWAMSQGYRIAYTKIARHGDKDGPPIIFLHGGPGGYIHSSTIRTVGQLASLGHDVYLYDQIGSGLSDRLPKPKDYTFLGHVANLHEIVTRHIGARKVILIGHSYGGQLASQFAALHPNLLDRLVLSSPGTIQPTQFDAEGRWVNSRRYIPPASLRFVEPKSVPMDGLRFWPPRVLAAMALSTAFNVKLMPDEEADAALNTLASRFTQRIVCDPRDVLPEEGGAGMYVRHSNFYGDLEDPRPAIRRVKAPVLVLQGACDYIPYASTFEYVDVFPGARYVFIEGAGHIIWWEKPEEYLRHIRQFLDASKTTGNRTLQEKVSMIVTIRQ